MKLKRHAAKPQWKSPPEMSRRRRGVFRGRDGALSKQGAALGASGKPRYVLRSVDSFFEDRFGEVIARRFASSSHVVRAADLRKKKIGYYRRQSFRPNSCRLFG
jgi:hypothetical protein